MFNTKSNYKWKSQKSIVLQTHEFIIIQFITGLYVFEELVSLFSPIYRNKILTFQNAIMNRNLSQAQQNTFFMVKMLYSTTNTLQGYCCHWVWNEFAYSCLVVNWNNCNLGFITTVNFLIHTSKTHSDVLFFFKMFFQCMFLLFIDACYSQLH